MVQLTQKTKFTNCSLKPAEFIRLRKLCKVLSFRETSNCGFQTKTNLRLWHVAECERLQGLRKHLDIQSVNTASVSVGCAHKTRKLK